MDSLSLSIIVIIALVLLNGIFSAGEFGIVSSRKSKIKDMIKEEKDKRAEVLLQMRENPEKFLPTVQIGITVFGTLASALAGVVSIHFLNPVIKELPYVGRFSESVSLIIVVLCLTYLLLVLGELVPKHIGINYREKVAITIAPMFDFLSRVLFLPVRLLNVSSSVIMRLLHLRQLDEPVTEDEIKLLLEEGRTKGVFGRTEEELIHGVFNFVDRSVKEIMVPRPNIYAIDMDQSKEEILKYVVDNEFSRYPAYKDQLDNIQGIVYHKDMAKFIWSNTPFDLNKVLRKPYFVPDTMKVSALLKDMQRRRVHLAVVVDEYGTTVGIVSLEDIMEEIFGEIMDETDTDVRIVNLPDGATLIDASYNIRDLNNDLGLELPESADYETLGGFVLSQLQGIARGGEIVYHDGYRFTVVGIHRRRIAKVKMEKIDKEKTQNR
ncbi:MAG TPA: hemolysin family protein [Syntrophorhabdales bacterium]|nr:hemolysin family protein [Syntrophorhabdales bacterium]